MRKTRYTSFALLLLTLLLASCGVNPQSTGLENQVLSLTPNPGATNVARDIVISVRVDGDLSGAEAAGAFTLATKSGASVAGTVTVSDSKDRAAFTPSAPLLADTVYVATIQGSFTAPAIDVDIKNGTLAWSFTTGATNADGSTPPADGGNGGGDDGGNDGGNDGGDNGGAPGDGTDPGDNLPDPGDGTGGTPTSPTVKSASPRGALVSIFTSVTARFGVEMDEDSFTASSFMLFEYDENAAGKRGVQVTVTDEDIVYNFDALENEAVLYPPTLKPGTKYLAVLTDGVKSQQGASLTPFQWDFTTAPDQVIPSEFPQVVSITIGSITYPIGTSITEVSPSAAQSIVVNFSTDMRASTVNTSNVRMKPKRGRPIRNYTASLSTTDAKKANIAVAQTIQAGREYRITLTRGITDTNGVPLQQTYHVFFTTRNGQ